MVTTKSSTPTGFRTCQNVCWWISGIIFVIGLLIVFSLVFYFVFRPSRPVQVDEKSFTFPTTSNGFHSKETRTNKKPVVTSSDSTTTVVTTPESTITAETSPISKVTTITSSTTAPTVVQENPEIRIISLVDTETKAARPKVKPTTSVPVRAPNTKKINHSNKQTTDDGVTSLIDEDALHITSPIDTVLKAAQSDTTRPTTRPSRVPDANKAMAIKETTSVNEEASIIQSEMHHATVATNLSSTYVPQDSTNKIQSEKPHQYSDEERKNFIRNMTVIAWNAYKNIGWGCGELVYSGKNMNYHHGQDCQVRSPSPKHVTSGFWQGSNVKWVGGPSYKYSGLHWSKGATIVTGLDTLFIMNLTTQVEEGKKWVQYQLYIEASHPATINIKRTIPTYIGALLSCYFLTNDTVFMTKANQIVNHFYSEYNQPLGLRRNFYSTESYSTEWGKAFTYEHASVFSQLNIEFHYLSDVTGNETYRNNMLNDAGTIMSRNEIPNALFRNSASLDFYEQAGVLWPKLTSESGGNYLDYLLKSWLKGRRKDADLRQYLITVADSVINNTIKTRGNFTYVSIYDWPDTSDEGYMAHSLCYLGGWFALAGAALGGAYKEQYVKVGKNITRTCHEAHFLEPHPLPAGYFQVTADRLKLVPNIPDSGYQLTAQTVESYFILWRITHNQMYRNWGWELAQAIMNHTKKIQKKHDELKQSILFGQLPGYPRSTKLGLRQHMTLISETLKYLYLIFCDDNDFSLDEWIFNANGHPLPIDNERKRQLII